MQAVGVGATMMFDGHRAEGNVEPKAANEGTLMQLNSDTNATPQGPGVHKYGPDSTETSQGPGVHKYGPYDREAQLYTTVTPHLTGRLGYEHIT